MKKFDRIELLQYLDELYESEYAVHRREQNAIGNASRIAILGGSLWMDSHFRCEALRGCISALRAGSNLEKAVENGKTVSTIAVQLWNTKRGKHYTCQRWENTAHDFLETKIRIFMQRQPLFQIREQLRSLNKSFDQIMTAVSRE